MSYRRPPRLKSCDYKGKRHYFVTCSTAGRAKRFTHSSVVAIVTEQILRTCTERQFEALAYVFMEDHLHLLIRGASQDSDLKSMMTLMRQRTALAFTRARGDQLWQDGYFDRVLRQTDDVFEVVRYIRENPSKAGLGEERTRYPYVWWAGSDTRSAPL